MGDFTHKAGQRPKVNLITTDDAGNETPHPFEVLPINKPLMDKIAAHAKVLAPLQARVKELEQADDMPSDDERHQMEQATVEICDLQLASTNGPVTIASLWEDGLLAAKDLRLLSEYLQAEASGNPPA
jgi:hypothetical protein